MKKQLLLTVICIIGLSEMSAARIKSFSQNVTKDNEKLSIEKNEIKKVRYPRPEENQDKSVNYAKEERIAAKRMIKAQRESKRHLEQKQAPHDIPGLVSKRNELMPEIALIKSQIHDSLQEANRINRDMNLDAKREYRKDKKGFAVELNQLRLESRQAGAENRIDDKKDLDTQIQNLQGFGVTPEAQIMYDEVDGLRSQLADLQKEQRCTISDLREKCAKAHVKYEPAKHSKETEVKKEKSLKKVKMKKMQKQSSDNFMNSKMSLKKAGKKENKVKKEKLIKPVKEKIAKPVKVKKSKVDKKETSMKMVEKKVIKPVKMKKSKVDKKEKMASKEDHSMMTKALK